MSIQPEYLAQEACIFRECPVKGCTEVIEGNSHSEQVNNLHDHLRSSHTWSEKQRWM